MNPERRLQVAQRIRPLSRVDTAAAPEMAGNKITQHHDQIGTERVGVPDDAADPLRRHPRPAGVDIGDDGDAEGEIRRPRFWPRPITGGQQRHQRLDPHRIPRGRDARQQRTNDRPDEPASADHVCSSSCRSGLPSPPPGVPENSPCNLIPRVTQHPGSAASAPLIADSENSRPGSSTLPNPKGLGIGSLRGHTNRGYRNHARDRFPPRRECGGPR